MVRTTTTAARRLDRAALVLVGAETMIRDALADLPESLLKERLLEAMHRVLSARATIEISAENLRALNAVEDVT